MGKVSKKAKNFAKTGSGSKKTGKGSLKHMESMPVTDESMPDELIRIKKPKKGNVESFGSSSKKHKQEMADLATQDPEFYEYLKENDASLLSFGDDDEENEEEDLEEDLDLDQDDEDLDSEEEEEEEEEEEYTSKKSKKGGEKHIEVNAAFVETTSKAAVKGSQSALKKMIAMFRTACIPNADNSQSTGPMSEFEGPSSKYLINDAAIYQQVMDTSLATLHKAFYKIFEINGDIDKEQLSSLSSHPKWKKMQLVVLSFYKSYMHLLAGLARGTMVDDDNEDGGDSDENSDSDSEDRKKKPKKRSSDGEGKKDSPHAVAVYLLRSIDPYLCLLTPMPRLCKALLKVLLFIWTEGPDPASDTFNLRGHAFIKLRQVCLKLPGSYTEEVFRSMYLSFARTSKSFTEMSAPSVLFMTRCLIELFKVDLPQTYQQGFLYIRQLALHLRTVILKKNSDNMKLITSWQFMNCLRLWTRVLCAMPASDELGALAFPLSQVLLGVVMTVESAYYTPLKFHCIGCLQMLAAHCKYFIPTSAKLLEILEKLDVTSKMSASTELPPQMQYLVKLPNDSLTRASVRDTIVEEIFQLIRQDCELYRYHVGFPEYAFLTVRKIKAFTKSCKVSKWRDLARALSTVLESYITYAKEKRITLGKSPLEVTDFEPLLATSKDTEDCTIRWMKLLAGRGHHMASEVILASSTTSSLKKSEEGPKKGKKKAANASLESSKKKMKKKKKGESKESASIVSETTEETVRNFDVDSFFDDL